MNKRVTSLSIAAMLAASAFAVQAQGNTYSSNNNNTAQSAETQRGVPGVDVDIGKNASNSGLPGVEMNAGAQGDQKNMNTDTKTLGAGSDTKTTQSKAHTKRVDRN